MTEALLILTVYGYLVRQVVEFLQAIFRVSGKDHPRVVQGMAVVVSAVFVYWLGLNPVALLGLGKLQVFLDGAAAQPVGVALLAGAAASTNDLLDLVARMGGAK